MPFNPIEIYLRDSSTGIITARLTEPATKNAGQHLVLVYDADTFNTHASANNLTVATTFTKIPQNDKYTESYNVLNTSAYPTIGEYFDTNTQTVGYSSVEYTNGTRTSWWRDGKLIANGGKVIICAIIQAFYLDDGIYRMTQDQTFTGSGFSLAFSPVTTFPFVATTNFAGGYHNPAAPLNITVSAQYYSEALNQYSVAGGTLYYKKTSAGSYTSINFTGSTVTVPANTFQDSETYDMYIKANADSGETYDTAVVNINTADAVPTVEALSPSNRILYGTAQFNWNYSVPTGTAQTAFDIQTSTDQLTWTDIASHAAGSETSYEATVSQSGTVYWRVRGYNTADVASAWSNVLSFVNNTPPDPPTISAVSGTGRLTVTWNADDQLAYQVMVGDYDSGWVYSPNKSYFLNEFLPGGAYLIKVRVANSLGQLSDWATVSFTQPAGVSGPAVSVEMQEGFNKLTISGSFDTYYIIRNGIPVAQTAAGEYMDYFCNGVDNYVVRGVNSDDTFGDTTVSAMYTCRKPALITAYGEIIYVNERLDEQPQITSVDALDVVSVSYLGRTKPVHHVGKLLARTWTVACSEQLQLGKIYFYRNFRGDKAWVICKSVQSSLNWFGVHEYQFTLEETDYSEGIEYEV